jgi:hypothetical protein
MRMLEKKPSDCSPSLDALLHVDTRGTMTALAGGVTTVTACGRGAGDQALGTTRVGGLPLLAVAEQLGRLITESVRARDDEEVRRAGYRIRDGKGFTSFGIGATITRVVDAVRDDGRAAEIREATTSIGY